MAAASSAGATSVDESAVAIAIDMAQAACEKLAKDTFHQQAVAVLKTVNERLLQGLLGRRPGVHGRGVHRKDYVGISDKNPQKALRVDFYEKIDKVLDLVWPVTNATGTERARKSRGNLSREERVAANEKARDATFKEEEARLLAEIAAEDERRDEERKRRKLPPPPLPPPPRPKRWQAQPRPRHITVTAPLRELFHQRQSMKHDGEVRVVLRTHAWCACCGSEITKKCTFSVCKCRCPGWHEHGEAYVCPKCTPGFWDSAQSERWPYGRERYYSHTILFQRVPGCTCHGEYVPIKC